MYIRFTPRQLGKLKEFMKTVKLNAYDITLYQEILRTLENPIDENQMQSVLHCRTVTTNQPSKVVHTPVIKSPTIEKSEHLLMEDEFTFTESSESTPVELETVDTPIESVTPYQESTTIKTDPTTLDKPKLPTRIISRS